VHKVDGAAAYIMTLFYGKCVPVTTRSYLGRNADYCIPVTIVTVSVEFN